MQSEYFSHVSILAAAMTMTSGPVLELGTGYGSTLMLHGLCGASQRKLISLESDKEWMLKFLNYGRSWHSIRYTDDYADIIEYNNQWGLVFVDHGISEQRGHSVRMLKDTPIIVAHDTCHHFLYDYEPTLSEFKYRYDYKLGGPMTTVVSNSIDVAAMFGGCCL
jgi:predicted O-methyltransferase YrrM